MTKTADAAPAADATAAATGEKAVPAHVESGELMGVEDADEPAFTDEQARACMTDLVLLDLRLRAEGHTLADVLATAAKNAYGVDVR